MKKVFIGLGIGCGVLVLGFVGLFVGGAWYAKKKLGGVAEYAQKAQKQQLEVTAKSKELDRKYPFQLPASGAPIALTADRVETYLAVREDALPIYEDFKKKAEGFEAKHKNAGQVECVGAAFEAAGMLGDLMMQLRTSYLTSLDTRHMSPREFGAITGAVYTSAWGAAAGTSRDAVKKQLAQLDEQLKNPSSPELKQALEQQRTALQEAEKNLPAPKDDATFQANAKLMEKYKDRIEKSVNPAFDSFILASDSGDAFSRQMGALGHPQDDDKGE